MLAEVLALYEAKVNLLERADFIYVELFKLDLSVAFLPLFLQFCVDRMLSSTQELIHDHSTSPNVHRLFVLEFGSDLFRSLVEKSTLPLVFVILACFDC